MDVYEAIALRRDVRNEFTGDVIDDATLFRILGAAHRAPSVGNTQPWDFIIVQNTEALVQFAAHVAGERERFASTLDGERAATFKPITIDGVVRSGTGIVVTYTPSRGGPHILGRNTIDEVGRLSVALAIENLWLAATAEGHGVGWVSFYQPEWVEKLIGCPDDVEVIAWLCIGPVAELASSPDLERLGWRGRRQLREALHFEAWHEESFAPDPGGDGEYRADPHRYFEGCGQRKTDTESEN